MRLLHIADCKLVKNNNKFNIKHCHSRCIVCDKHSIFSVNLSRSDLSTDRKFQTQQEWRVHIALLRWRIVMFYLHCDALLFTRWWIKPIEWWWFVQMYEIVSLKIKVNTLLWILCGRTTANLIERWWVDDIICMTHESSATFQCKYLMWVKPSIRLY